jgi:hypothetical protein
VSIYHKSHIVTSEDGLSSRQVAGVDTGTILDGEITVSEHEESPIELADEPEGEKPLKAHTVPELVDIAKGLGASEDSVKHLKKPELLEAIERLTHASDD